jgi:hypothetical protein
MCARAFGLASSMIGLACGPQASLDFSGSYAVTEANGTWSIDHPEAPSFIVSYFVDDVVIDEDGTGIFSLELPLPPCRIVGRIEHDRIRLSADDCVVEVEASGAEEYVVEYTDGHGSGRWEDEGLVLRMETARRYDRILSGFPEWWDDPGRCSSSYTLEPLE